MSPFDLDAMQRSMSESPLIGFLGLRIERADAESGEIVCRCDMKPQFERLPDSGQWHGGILSSIIDTVGDYAVGQSVGRPLPTVNFRTDYLKPATGATLVVKGMARRVGKSIAVADVEVLNEQGAVVALGRATYAVA
jgi:uncharacterized protein (TIGR00369 family)